jgi:hypothetical protein
MCTCLHVEVLTTLQEGHYPVVVLQKPHLLYVVHCLNLLLKARGQLMQTFRFCHLGTVSVELAWASATDPSPTCSATEPKLSSQSNRYVGYSK